MSQFRNLSRDELVVVYGVGFSPKVVPPDGVVTVDDEADEAYECQDIWGKVTAPAKPVEKPAKAADTAEKTQP